MMSWGYTAHSILSDAEHLVQEQHIGCHIPLESPKGLVLE